MSNETETKSKAQSQPDWAIIIPTWDLDRAMRTAAQACRWDNPSHVVIVNTGPIGYSLTQIAKAVDDFSQGKFGAPGAEVPPAKFPMVIESNPGELALPVEAMRRGADLAIRAGATNFLFLHDDTHILGPWRGHMHLGLELGADLIGFGGRKGFGTQDIYQTPYDYQQLIGIGFVSKMDNWRDHGEVLYGPQRVAYLDGFALGVPGMTYTAVGGWAKCLNDGIEFHMYDAWLSLRVKEIGGGVYAVPVLCHHDGGSTSVLMKENYETAVRSAGYLNGQHLFDQAHKVIYERFRGQLPIAPYPPAPLEAALRLRRSYL